MHGTTVKIYHILISTFAAFSVRTHLPQCTFCTNKVLVPMFYCRFSVMVGNGTVNRTSTTFIKYWWEETWNILNTNLKTLRREGSCVSWWECGLEGSPRGATDPVDLQGTGECQGTDYGGSCMVRKRQSLASASTTQKHQISLRVLINLVPSRYL